MTSLLIALCNHLHLNFVSVVQKFKSESIFVHMQYQQEGTDKRKTHCSSQPRTPCRWGCDAASSSYQKDLGSSNSQMPPLLWKRNMFFRFWLFRVCLYVCMVVAVFLPEQCRLRASSVAITCMISPILSRSMSPNSTGWDRMYMARYTIISCVAFKQIAVRWGSKKSPAVAQIFITWVRTATLISWPLASYMRVFNSSGGRGLNRNKGRGGRKFGFRHYISLIKGFT